MVGKGLVHGRCISTERNVLFIGDWLDPHMRSRSGMKISDRLSIAGAFFEAANET